MLHGHKYSSMTYNLTNSSKSYLFKQTPKLISNSCNFINFKVFSKRNYSENSLRLCYLIRFSSSITNVVVSTKNYYTSIQGSNIIKNP